MTQAPPVQRRTHSALSVAPKRFSNGPRQNDSKYGTRPIERRTRQYEYRRSACLEFGVGPGQCDMPYCMGAGRGITAMNRTRHSAPFYLNGIHWFWVEG